MSEQLPSIDPSIREQLARRASGKLPEDLLTAIYAGLDVAPPQPPRLTLRRVPRMALAGGALALTAILTAALLVVPRSQIGPAASGQWSYPADHALTSADLALLMAGPALPTNTALVANVNMYVRSDTCPMNRYRTVGIVEGMASQVCVVTASDVLIQPFALSGTFAFRYLAPGVLGLLGEIAPVSPSRVAFHVNDDWPLAGKTFLVEGWLGAEGLVYPCPSLAPAWDVLSPNGEDCPNDNWLSDDPSAPLIDTSVAVGPQSTRDATKLYGNARIVEAGGMRQIDSIDHGTPVRGVYVVRSVTEQCPGALPQDSGGCSAWRVLAKVAEISVPPPRGTQVEAATAAPTTAPPATPLVPALTGVIGTGNQPLTADELETLMVAQPDHLAGRIVIAKSPIPTQISCQTDSNGGGCAVNTKPLAGDGVWAVSIGADGALSLIGQMSTPATGGYVFTLDQVQTKSGSPGTGLAIVDAWLDWENGCDAPPVPYGSGGCGTSMLTAEKLSWMHMAALLPPGAVVTWVQSDAYRTFGSQDLSSGGVHGLYLVEVADQTAPKILARMEAVTP